jgi:hypothetical protein
MPGMNKAYLLEQLSETENQFKEQERIKLDAESKQLQLKGKHQLLKELISLFSDEEAK